MKSSDTDTELLTTAVERGYFKVPRQTSLGDIAEAHDMSDVEASERLRTELDRVLREHLDGVDATVAPEQD
ncbi:MULTISPECIES: helix-turn-helix domain-containing protein [Salinibaculum]|uniref:helix-turn-helix domain-containing protein n=1 Tax=Salinibaculum TaxID=2732368 RepID=UPI0030D5AF6F